MLPFPPDIPPPPPAHVVHKRATVVEPIPQFQALQLSSQELKSNIFAWAAQGHWGEVAGTMGFLEIRELETREHGHLIHMAAAHPRSGEVLIRLAKLEGLINLPDEHGCTPLLIAVKSRQSLKTIDALLSAGADPRYLDNHCRNILHLAIEAVPTDAFDTCDIFDTYDQLYKRYPELATQFDYAGIQPFDSVVEKKTHFIQNEGKRLSGQTPVYVTTKPPSKQPTVFEPTTSRRTTFSPKATRSPSCREQPLEPIRQPPEQFKGISKVDADFHEKIYDAIWKNDREAIRTLFEQRPASSFLPRYGHCDHIAFIACMDTDSRLRRAMYIYPKNYKADLHLWDQDRKSKRYSADDHLIVSGKALTRDSKLVVMGHGPIIGKMTASQLADELNLWLNKRACPEDQTPRITLHSCRTAERSGSNCYSSVAEEFVKRLRILGRVTEVTASSAKTCVFPDGEDLCLMNKKDEDDCYKVYHWQGSDVWLDTERQIKYALYNMTTQNRRFDLVKLITASPSLITTVQNKYDVQGEMKLHSLLNP